MTVRIRVVFNNNLDEKRDLLFALPIKTGDKFSILIEEKARFFEFELVMQVPGVVGDGEEPSLIGWAKDIEMPDRPTPSDFS
ncbi:hypothetical protein [Sphingobium sp. CCH11-B1]|uniref:hypothetical protein n=1 Tax=Sphingobium sp. CCH11-B1 TaxID=1768781 RepID=UPI00083360FC|nr:hypothetical protein [Sphingobium sp. CCH11-B1]